MQRRAIGPVERKARKDLTVFPKEYRDSAIAAAYLEAARLIDEGCPAREFASVSREMRLAYTQLVELGGKQKPDSTVDMLRKKREERDARYADGTGSST